MTVAKAVLPPVHVRTLGAGARKVLALHCTIAHSGAWSGLAVALGDQATLIATDMLSHGRSPDWGGQGDFFDLTTALSRAQLSEPMDVIGHSFGAMVALRLAIEYPDLVRLFQRLAVEARKGKERWRAIASARPGEGSKGEEGLGLC